MLSHILTACRAVCNISKSAFSPQIVRQHNTMHFPSLSLRGGQTCTDGCRIRHNWAADGSTSAAAVNATELQSTQWKCALFSSICDPPPIAHQHVSPEKNTGHSCFAVQNSGMKFLNGSLHGNTVYKQQNRTTGCCFTHFNNKAKRK